MIFPAFGLINFVALEGHDYLVDRQHFFSLVLGAVLILRMHICDLIFGFYVTGGIYSFPLRR